MFTVLGNCKSNTTFAGDAAAVVVRRVNASVFEVDRSVFNRSASRIANSSWSFANAFLKSLKARATFRGATSRRFRSRCASFGFGVGVHVSRVYLPAVHAHVTIDPSLRSSTLAITDTRNERFEYSALHAACYRPYTVDGVAIFEASLLAPITHHDNAPTSSCALTVGGVFSRHVQIRNTSLRSLRFASLTAPVVSISNATIHVSARLIGVQLNANASLVITDAYIAGWLWIDQLSARDAAAILFANATIAGETRPLRQHNVRRRLRQRRPHHHARVPPRRGVVPS